MRFATTTAFAVLTSLALAGCAGVAATGSGAALSCAAFEPIRWSVNDTDETIRQARGHNAAYVALCGQPE